MRAIGLGPLLMAESLAASASDENNQAPVAQRTEHEASTLGVAGSSPAGRAIPEKLCVFCRHLQMEPETESYSEMTGGNPAKIACRKGRWKQCIGYKSEDEFRANILRAATCQDYNQAKP